MTRPDLPDRRIPVGNTQMTRQEILDALESNIIIAKGARRICCATWTACPRALSAHMLSTRSSAFRAIWAGVLLQLVRALRDDNVQAHHRQLRSDARRIAGCGMRP